MKRREFNKLVAAGAVGAGLSGLGLPALAADATMLDKIKASGKLRIGGVTDGAPYYQKSVTDGKWRGFYVEISDKLAKDLGVTLDITPTTWGGAVLGLQAGKLDVFFGLNETPARLKVIDFSGPVFNNSFTMVVRKGLTGETWADFDKPDIRIAVDAGSSMDATVTKLCPKAQILRFATQGDATTALQSGRADAQCLAIVLALRLVAKAPEIGTVVVPTPIDSSASRAGYQRVEDKSWQDYVNKWITANRENGFIKEAIIKNMALVGVTPKDFPKGFSI